VRTHNPEALSIVEGGSFGFTVVCDVLRGRNRALKDVSPVDWSLSGDFDAKVKTKGQVTFAYQDEFGESFMPRSAGDTFAPFGSVVKMYGLLSLGAYEERIQLGTYRIKDAPEASEETVTVNGRALSTAVVKVNLSDLFYAADVPFMRLENPAALTSAWAEIARVSKLPVTRTVDDVAIPASVVYSRNRLSTVQQLAGVLGGRAYMRSDATIGVVPDDVGDPVLDLRDGELTGKIIDVGHSMTADDTFNAVYGDFEDANGRPIYAAARITDGPLSVDGPFGERPVEYPGDQKQFIKTQTAADTAVANHLAKVSKGSPLEIPVTMTPHPLVEFDTVRVHRPGGGSFVGRVVKWSLARGRATEVTVRVPNA